MKRITQTEVECFTKTQPEMVKEMYFDTPCSSTFRLISPRMPWWKTTPIDISFFHFPLTDLIQRRQKAWKPPISRISSEAFEEIRFFHRQRLACSMAQSLSRGQWYDFGRRLDHLLKLNMPKEEGKYVPMFILDSIRLRSQKKHLYHSHQLSLNKQNHPS